MQLFLKKYFQSKTEEKQPAFQSIQIDSRKQVKKDRQKNNPE